MFLKHPKLSTYFRSKLDEYAMVIDGKPVVNMAISDETVLFQFANHTVEFYKKDSIKIVTSMIEDLQKVVQHLKE
jgi:hypothetical protein